jgi:hypothetical protein
MSPEARQLLERALRLSRQVPTLHEGSYRLGTATEETMPAFMGELKVLQRLMSEASGLERDIGALLLSKPEATQ